MKLLLTLLLAVLPAAANDSNPSPQEYAIPMEATVGSFEREVEDTWAKVRRLRSESRHKQYSWEVNDAIARHDPEAAQKALDKLLKDFPEAAKNEPHAIEYHQAGIDFWKKDFAKAYYELDKIVKGLEDKYPKGIPPGKYFENNTSFMADAYFARGATEMQLRKFAPAVKDMEKAFSLAPKAYMPLNMCRALLQLRKYKEASDAYDLAYKMNAAVAEKAEDRDYLCERLSKNNLQPKPCIKAGTEPSK